MAPEAPARPGPSNEPTGATDEPPALLTGPGGILPRLQRTQVLPRTVLVVLLTGLALLGGLFLLWELRQLVRWLVISLFLAVALDPPVSWLARRLPRGLSIFIVYLVLLLALALVGGILIPPLAGQVQGLALYIVDQLQQQGGPNQALQDLARRFGVEAYVGVVLAQLTSLPGRLLVAAGPLLALTRGLVGSVTAMMAILLMTYFLLADGERFVATLLRLFTPAQRPRLIGLLEKSARTVSRYVTGIMTIALIAGVTSYIVLSILGMPYALALALVVTLFDVIPLVGATIGAAIVTLIGFFVDPIQGLILLVFFLFYQQIENSFLQPTIQGRNVQLHPLVIFLAVLAGGELMGILGALLAIPIAETIRIVGAEWLSLRGQRPEHGVVAPDMAAAGGSAAPGLSV